MTTRPLSAPQSRLVAQLSLQWRSVAALRAFNPRTLQALKKTGLVQTRYHKYPYLEAVQHEARLIALIPSEDHLKDAVLRLINAMAPSTRKLLNKEIADVLEHIVIEESTR